MTRPQRPGIGNAFLGKVPPHTREAELSVLGSCLLKQPLIDDVLEVVQPSDFYGEAHGLVYQAILDLHAENRSVDMVTIGELLKDRGELEAVGGLAYLSSILDAVPTTASVLEHAKLVREKARVRAALGVALDILEQGYGDYGNAQEYLSRSLRSLETAVTEREKHPAVTYGEAIRPALKRIEAEANAKTDLTGIPTGFPALDRFTGGLQPGDLVIVAGRPSMGKTALAENILEQAAMRGHPGMIFSLEMSAEQIMRRALSRNGRVDSTKLRVPRMLERADMYRLVDAGDQLYSMPITIDDSPELTVHEIRARARRYTRKLGLKLLVVDYLQIIMALSKGRDDETRARELAGMTRALKALAKELQVPVVCLSQLNRGPEARQNKRPMVADLRESGAIEQDADLILLMYREAFYKPDCGHQMAEIIVGKNRNGPTGTATLRFIGELTRFEEPAFDDDEAHEPPPPRYGGMLDPQQGMAPFPGPPEDDDGPF